MSIKQIAEWSLKIGLFIVAALTPFIVPGSMFFPYIVGKNFFFRIAIETLFVLWANLAFWDKRYRPTISPLLYAVAITLVSLIISTIFGANPYRSFWSNYERMEGLVGHLHLFAYFLMLSSSIIGRLEWRRFFYGLSLFGAVMAVYGYMQYFGVVSISQQSGVRLDGTFGNATYLAIFILINIFLLIYLALTEERGGNLARGSLAVLAVLEIPILFLTATRGAILGFLGGLLLLGILLLVAYGGRRARLVSGGLVAAVLTLIIGFWLIKDTTFVRGNYVLQRFATLSLHERTVESRLTIWKMSIEGFKERPLFGWGIENYNQVFNKYYDPVLWRQEPWFDRSHNVFFDWLIAGGLVGLISYLSIFAVAVYMLWRAARRADFRGAEMLGAAALTALFAAYFFHNLFVFDNIISYVLFFTVVAFVQSVYSVAPEDERSTSGLSLGAALKEEIYPFAAVGFAVLMAITMYFINVKPILANFALLQTLQDMNTKWQQVDLIIADFNKIFSYNTFGSGEAREQLAGYINNIARANIAPQDKAKVYELTIKELEKQAEVYPHDTRSYLFLSSVYSAAARPQDALVAANKALELSPKKQQIYFLLADLYIGASQLDKAREVMKYAYDLDQNFDQAAVSLAVIEIMDGQGVQAEELLMEKFGTINVADQKLISAYARVGNYVRVRDLWLAFLKDEPDNFQYHVNLAAAYLHTGERDKSVAELQSAIALNPQFQKQGEYYIGEIKAGRNP